MFVRELVPNNSPHPQYLRSKSAPINLHQKNEQSSAVSTPGAICRGLPIQDSIVNLPQQSSNRITLNVRGCHYETLEETLSKFPDTLLGNPTRRKEYYDSNSNEYRFLRDPESFNAILFYYQSEGILSKPVNIRRDIFEKELSFFGISIHFDKRHQFEQNLIAERTKKDPMPDGKLRKILWRTFEYPNSSCVASVIGLLSIAMILISVLAICAETIPELKRKEFKTPKKIANENSTETVKTVSYGNDHWFIIEAMCITWFTVEYIIRGCSAPKRWKFVSSALGIVDLVSITPFYVTLALQIKDTGRNVVNTLGLIRMLRLCRIVRVFKLTRYNEGLRILVMTIYESSIHLRSLVLVIMIMAVFFATMVYYIETINSGTSDIIFSSVPDTVWFSIITMTTVGYGDVYPQTPGGKLIGALCGIFGVLLFCLPSPVLVNKFIECYYLRQTLSDDESHDRKKFVESMKEVYFKGN